MKIGERILLALSKTPGGNDYPLKDSSKNIDAALDLLCRVYPNFSSLVSGKKVIDFGCGNGYQSIALVKRFGCSVVGIDMNQKTLNNAISNAKEEKILPDQLSFVDRIYPNMLNRFDVVISQNSFEHFEDPEHIINQMSSLLKQSGIALITFGPPWFSPYGSHMHFFCKLPWINIIFSESTVMEVRKKYRDDGAKRYEEVESGLNKMTVARFENIIRSTNLTLAGKNYECIKGMNWLARLPILRELFINHVTAVLFKAR